MGNEANKKFTWVIKNFSSLSEKVSSDQFVVGGCKWSLSLYPKGDRDHSYLALYLYAADYRSLPSGWRRHTRCPLTIVNQHSGKPSITKEVKQWFDEKTTSWGFSSMLPLIELHAKDSGFLVNDELKIVAEVDLLEVIGKVEVNGFYLLPSQVEFVSRMFERHPEIASEFLPKNSNLRTGYMSLLLSLIDTLRKSPHELPNNDLDDAHAALNCLTCVGFKLDWLEKKLDQVSEKKEKEKAGEIEMLEIEEQLKDLKQKCSDLEAQLEKKKAEVSAAKSPISFDDDDL